MDEKGRVVPATDASTESAADTDSQHSFISTVLDGDPRAFSSVWCGRRRR